MTKNNGASSKVLQLLLTKKELQHILFYEIQLES
jgi:hypothetical protein